MVHCVYCLSFVRIVDSWKRSGKIVKVVQCTNRNCGVRYDVVEDMKDDDLDYSDYEKMMVYRSR
jgi:hypothetical protein